MLWYRYWLETRWRLVVGIAVPFVNVLLSRMQPASDSQRLDAFVIALGLLLAFSSITLAGSGIQTQSATLRPMRGSHGSLLYTLSLPVSRARMVAMRGLLGISLLALMCVINSLLAIELSVPMRGQFSTLEAVEFGLVMTVFCSVFYFLSSLLAAFLDGLGQAYGSAALAVAAAWLASRLHLPESLNFFQAFARLSPFLTHQIPWSLLATAAGVSAGLFVAAWQVAERREY